MSRGEGLVLKWCSAPSCSVDFLSLGAVKGKTVLKKSAFVKSEGQYSR